MRSTEFIEYISAHSPTVEQLITSGYSEELALEEVRSLHPERMKGFENLDNPLLDLCINYTFISSLPFGIVFSKPTVTEHFWIVGGQEGDMLTIDKISGEVQIEEQRLKNRWTLFRCAATGSDFLSAYGYAIGHIYKPVLSNVDAINKCATLAGGSVYYPFYEAVLS